ncbi:MAG: hypothetical protein QS721_10400 [Candidatus Endonucleobacter sp. (ex Gigantidas childressi)]|nr:hypothetical protein [Candidatus Endonucleobacter sp. (ex Gigantidas childressi)]
MFDENMKSIYQGVLSLVNQENTSSSFIYGTYLVGFVSAYEIFIHDLFEICCNRKKYIDRALKNIDELESHDINHLRMRSEAKRTEEYLIERLKTTTLHDPIQVARIPQVIFNLKMPTLNNEFTEILLSQKNAFTHNGGFSNGESIDITVGYLLVVAEFIY